MGKHFADVETGEILRVSPLDGKRYAYSGGYATMGLVNITKLVRADLPADGYRLALLIAVRAVSVSGFARCTNQEYAQELGVTPTKVSHLIRLLCDLDFIYRAGPRIVIVNPYWCFKGTPLQHHVAIENWLKLHGMTVIEKPVTRKTA